MARSWSEAVHAATRVRRQIPDVARDALHRAGRVGVRLAQQNASGRVLQRRTGRLAKSVTYTVTLAGGVAELRLRSDSPYARIHEMGGTIHGRPWLKFQLPDGSWRQVEQVVIPARPWMRPAILEAEREVPRALQAALRPLLNFERG